ncbi:peptide-methionine (S)-S-oxide reductase MsrA [Flavobacterium sp. TMP13]|uniref:peptide-methionine (S)-S-oxide reductase MsrA n=1 Tax=unclassified Flavobacterium TaxID=196869 RepID=UPI00076C0645|nr:peptide-methionine (S)-S-oxide reductase MsrA [Flavobacterium sp. TAB 87]KVV14663.1 Peptide methionine sulfoxide reductase MsrA [Flavobacterium sp. TAB 87]
MKNQEVATFGGGCFWCIEAIIQRLKGIISIQSGYAGGFIKNPPYREVCSGRTGHAEVIQVTFDPEIISYKEIIFVFLTSHDPTTLNQQGADRGTQYRSIILYHDKEQQQIVNELFDTLKPIFEQPIVTELTPLEVFYEAEEEHQNYYNNNREAGYCTMVIDPKIQKLKKMYIDKLA